MKKYLQKLGQNSVKASLEKVGTTTKNKVLLKFSGVIKKNLNVVTGDVCDTSLMLKETKPFGLWQITSASLVKAS